MGNFMDGVSNFLGDMGQRWDQGMFGAQNPVYQAMGPGGEMARKIAMMQMLGGLGQGGLNAQGIAMGATNMQASMADSIQQTAALQKQKMIQEEQARWNQLAQGNYNLSNPQEYAEALARLGSPDAAQMAAQMGTSMYNTNLDHSIQRERLDQDKAYRNEVLKRTTAKMEDGNDQISRIKAGIVAKVAQGIALSEQDREALDMIAGRSGNPKDRIAAKLERGEDLTPGETKAMTLYGVDAVDLEYLNSTGRTQTTGSDANEPDEPIMRDENTVRDRPEPFSVPRGVPSMSMDIPAPGTNNARTIMHMGKPHIVLEQMGGMAIVLDPATGEEKTIPIQ